MKEIEIDRAQIGRRLDRVVKAYLPNMPQGLIQKSLRTGEIRVNGAKKEANYRAQAGDRLQLNVDEAFTENTRKVDRFLAGFRHHVRVVYEDENVLLVDKPVGVICHADEREKVNTLIHHVQAYLYQKGEDCDVALCNRIDRFTGGIVICAKNAEAVHDMDMRIRAGKVKKYYVCVIRGGMRPEEGVLDNYLYQREGEKRVRLSTRPVEGAKRAVTAYRTLERKNGLSLMECELFTGRTHQIRAQFAETGHPLVGDAQYGEEYDGGRGCQSLYAWRVSFEKTGGMLDYLEGKSFRVRDVPFVRDYFGGEE